jgi:hypothetical protein
MLKGNTYTTFPPMMTSSSFDFRVYLKNIFNLEPLLKLATFVVEEVIFQNVKKKVYLQKYVQAFFSHSKTSNDNLRNKIRFLPQF